MPSTRSICNLSLAVASMFAGCDLPEQTPEQRQNEDIHGAWIAAQDAVMAQLAAPATAKFPFGGAVKHVRAMGDGRYIVDSYVDAQNHFGAMIRIEFVVELRKDESNKWHLESISLGDE